MDYTIKQGDTFGQIVLNNKELMKQLRQENPNATIWGDNGIIAKAAAMAGFTDKNGDGSIIDDAGSIYAGDTIDFSKAAKEKLAKAKKTDKPEYSPFIKDYEEYKEKEPISSLMNDVTTDLLTETKAPAKDPISSVLKDASTKDLLAKPQETKAPVKEEPTAGPAETKAPVKEVPAEPPAPAEPPVPEEAQGQDQFPAAMDVLTDKDKSLIDEYTLDEKKEYPDGQTASEVGHLPDGHKIGIEYDKSGRLTEFTKYGEKEARNVQNFYYDKQEDGVYKEEVQYDENGEQTSYTSYKEDRKTIIDHYNKDELEDAQPAAPPALEEIPEPQKPGEAPASAEYGDNQHLITGADGSITDLGGNDSWEFAASSQNFSIRDLGGADEYKIFGDGISILDKGNEDDNYKEISGWRTSITDRGGDEKYNFVEAKGSTSNEIFITDLKGNDEYTFDMNNLGKYSDNYITDNDGFNTMTLKGVKPSDLEITYSEDKKDKIISLKDDEKGTHHITLSDYGKPLGSPDANIFDISEKDGNTIFNWHPRNAK